MRRNPWLTFLLQSLLQSNVVRHVHASFISKWHPTVVECDSVSQSYPESFWQKLTSSTPRRQFALENVSLSLDSKMVTLLLGDSTAGKSTLLRLIAQREIPTSGEIKNSNFAVDSTVSCPIYLDARPSYRQNQFVEEIWTKAMRTGSSLTGPSSNAMGCLRELSDVLKVPLQSKIMDLSMSEVYLCRLGEAYLESLTGQTDSLESSSSTSLQSRSDEVSLSSSLPAPLILLDEWLDSETSTVVQRITSSLNELAMYGAVVVCVTHKPHLFGNGSFRRITLSRGKVLSIKS